MIVTIITSSTSWRVEVPGTVNPDGTSRPTTTMGPTQVLTRLMVEAVRMTGETFIPVRDVESQQDGLIRLGAIDSMEVEA